MMKKNLMFLTLAVVGLAGCNAGFKKAPGGLLYNIEIDKSGPKIKQGDFVSVNVVAKTDGDSVLLSTYEQGAPKYLVVQKSQPGDIVSVFPYMTEGDSATVKVNIDSMFKKGMQRPPIKGKYIIYDVKIEKVIPKGKPGDTTWNSQITKYTNSVAEVLRKAEGVKMKKYITDNKLNGTTTPDGLFYEVKQPGTGDKPAAGDTAVVYYTVKLMSGKVFESNVKAVAQQNKIYNPGLKYEPIRVPVGVKRMIPGWDEALQLMNKGTKATLVVPSKLAYGEQGYAVVPPFSPLVFDMELVDIVHPNPNAPKPAAPVLKPNTQVNPPTKK